MPQVNESWHGIRLKVMLGSMINDDLIYHIRHFFLNPVWRQLASTIFGTYRVLDKYSPRGISPAKCLDQ